jgi:hypothetical protein
LADANRDPVSSQGVAPVQRATLIHSGDFWTAGFGELTFSIRDLKGLSYIQRLLRHPHEEFHALDLLTEPGAAREIAGEPPDLGGLLENPAVQIRGAGDAGELLDAKAKASYRQRLAELAEELEDLRERGDRERAEQAEEEIEFLKREIVRAVGFGGRDRRAGSAAERARLSVTRAIKGAVQKIAEHDIPLADHLTDTIRTGSFCSYAPDPRAPVAWKFSAGEAASEAELKATAPIVFARGTNFLQAFAGRTAFVGREAERALLNRSLAQARQGVGRVVMITGPAGVGKTRMAAEVAAQAAREGVLTLVGRCYDRDDSVPFIPFVEILEAALGLASSPEAFRGELGGDAPEIARLLPQLRRMFPDLPPPLELPPEQSRRLLFNAVSSFIARTARHTALLLLLDDLHWADQGTLLLLVHLAHEIAKLPVLIVGTYRDFELTPAKPLAGALDELTRLHMVEQVALGGLARAAVGQMLHALGGREPPDAVVDVIYAETEGNPFFVEELFQHLAEQGKLFDPQGAFRRDLKIKDIDVPQSVRLVIGRRLARLDQQTQQVLGTAAVIGRSFTLQLLEASTGGDAEALLDRVEEAEGAGLITSTIEYPDARFRFAHELIRQAMLGSLSGARRQRLHLDVANAMERLYPDALEDHADDLAHHLVQAGAAADPSKTVRYLAMAAKRAREQGALPETEALYRQALTLLQKIPESRDRDHQELALQLALALVFVATRGYTAAETTAAYDRASVLAGRLGEPIQVVLALSGLYAQCFLRGEMHAAEALADRIQGCAERDGSPATLAWAHQLQGVVKYHLGNLTRAFDHFEKAIVAYREADHTDFPEDPGVESLDYAALTAWQLGMPDTGRARMRDATALAERLRKPYELGHNRFYAAYLQILFRDAEATLRGSEAVIALAQQYAMPLYVEAGRILRGWALAEQGRAEEGASCAREGLTNYMAGANRLALGSLLGFFAEARARAGALDEALATVEEGLGATPDQLVDQPYLLWLRGELLLRKGGAGDSAAEQSFRHAISLAHRIGAKSQALRAATSLGRLLKSKGRLEEARKTVGPIVNAFTEGLDTSDLIDARKLLEELSDQ